MLKLYRSHLFTLFALFYTITLPFLVFMSLGYDIEGFEIKNSLNVRLDTLPARAEVYDFDQKISSSTPIDIASQAGQKLFLKTEIKDYHSEFFSIYSQEDRNSSVKIDNLYLLPKKEKVIADFEKQRVLTLLSKDKLLFYDKNNTLNIANYDIGGISKPKPIQNLPARMLKAGKWKILDTHIFWNQTQNLVIFLGQDKAWSAFDISKLPFKSLEIKSLAKINSTNLMALDTNKNLWTIDMPNNSFSFFESGVDFLSFTDIPKDIWIFKQKKLYRLAQNQELLKSSFDLASNQVSQNFNLKLTSKDVAFFVNNNLDFFEVKNLFNGVMIKLGFEVYLLPDYDFKTWVPISKEAVVANSEGDIAIWLDKNNHLFVYNLNLKDLKNLGKLDLDGFLNQVELVYSNDWNRIFVYSQYRAFSFWYSRQTINPNIVKYYPVEFLIGYSCYPEIIERTQFCLNQNRLIIKENTNVNIRF